MDAADRRTRAPAPSAASRAATARRPHAAATATTETPPAAVQRRRRRPPATTEERRSRAATSSSAPSRSPTAWTGSPAAPVASWGVYTMRRTPCRGSFDFDATTAKLVPIILLDGEPKLETGPSSRSPTRSTRRRCGATGADHLRGLQVHLGADRQRQGHLRQDRLRDIEAVDDTDPTIAVVTYKEPYPAGRTSSAAATASSRRTSSTGKDRNAEMKDGYKFSGGPWMIETGTRAPRSSSSRTPSTGASKPEPRRRSPSSSSPTRRRRSRPTRRARSRCIYPQAQLELAQLKTAAGHQVRRHHRPVARGPVDQHLQGPVRLQGRAPGVRLRHRPRRDRRSALRAGPVRHQADQQPSTPPVFACELRRRRSRSTTPGPRQGRRAHDRRRLGQGRRRHLGQGRQEGRHRVQHDGRQQAPSS